MTAHILTCPKVAKGQGCTLCEEFAAVNEEIFNIESLLATLIAKRASICGRMNHIHDPLTSKLPAEIVSQIFMNFLPINVDRFYGIYDRDRFQQKTVTTPLLLGAVCAAWRTITWSTPQLWTSISIDLSEVSKTHINILRGWLSRSGELPLYIKIYTTQRHIKDTDTTQEIIDSIASCSHRWFYLELEKLLPSLFHSRDPAFAHAPNLNTLKIWQDEFEERIREINLGMFPNLRNLRLDMYLHDNLSGVDWQKLTKARIACISLNMCFKVLSNAPFLTHVTFGLSDYGFRDHDTDTTQDKILQHNHLVFLRLESWERSTNLLLHRIQLPALQHLDVHSWYPINVSTIVKFIRRSRCSLKTLAMDTTFQEPENLPDLILLLTTVPSLENLELESSIIHCYPSKYGSVDPLLKLLSTTSVCSPREDISQSPTMFLPNLKKLRIKDMELSWSCVLDVLLAHSDSDPILERTARFSEKSEKQHIRPLHSIDIDSSGLPHINLEPDMAHKLHATKGRRELTLNVAIATDLHIPDSTSVTGIPNTLHSYQT